MLDKIRAELTRIGAQNVAVEIDREFEPEAGELVKIMIDDAYWHMQPQHFLELLKEIGDQEGSEEVKVAIERDGHPVVYRGPSPEGTRDT